MHGCFAKERAVVHTANFLVSAPGEVFGEWLVTHGLWLPRSADMNSCVYFSLASLKDRVLWTVHIASKNCKTTSKEELRVSISRRVPSRVEKFFRKLEVGISKKSCIYMLSGEERTQKFQADACFLPDEVSVTAVVRDTKGTQYLLVVLVL
jgi:hypothetical protein